VIGGYTDPEGSRKFFGTLPIGFYGGKKLKFSGRVPIKRVADKIKGVILSEPGSALARQEGETAFGLDGRKSFLSKRTVGRSERNRNPVPGFVEAIKARPLDSISLPLPCAITPTAKQEVSNRPSGLPQLSLQPCCPSWPLFQNLEQQTEQKTASL